MKPEQTASTTQPADKAHTPGTPRYIREIEARERSSWLRALSESADAYVITMEDGQQFLCPDSNAAQECAEARCELGPSIDLASTFRVPKELYGQYRWRPDSKYSTHWREWPKWVTPASADDWTDLFHSYEQTVDAPPITFAIEGFLQADSITMLGGLPGHSKTLVALAMVRALLEGTPLFDTFKVPAPARRVLYLIPESSLAPFVSRLRTFHLTEFVGDRLFYRTLSSAEHIAITDPRILRAAEGADVFLDTAVRFMEGDENAAAEQRAFADNLFALLNAGARSVTGLHHSPKATERLDYMSLENTLRGSGDIGAMLATCWGLRQIDKVTNRVYVENVKPRDFQPVEPFIVEGRPSLDQTGYFKLVAKPGKAGTLNQHRPRCGQKPSGRPTDPDREAKVQQMLKLRAEGKSIRDIARAMDMNKDTVHKWLRDHDRDEAIKKAVDV